jgi:DNA-directed RNA polymerase subunit beta'
MALGAYWMTKEVAGALGEGKYFASPNDAINAFDYGVIDFRAKVKVLATDTESTNSSKVKFLRLRLVVFSSTQFCQAIISFMK